MKVTFAFTEEQQLLRSTAQKFLADRSDTDKVREDMAGEDGFDPALWRETAQMGWQAMAIPEEYGGAGYGWVEVGVLMEEMGRALFCAPFLSSAVLATSALLLAGSDEQKKEWLPGLASGETRATLAWHGAGSGGGVTVTADGDDLVLDGEASFVLDGHTADLIILAADEGEGISLVAVPADTDGITRDKLDALDQTRPLARVRFDGIRVPDTARLGEAGDAADVLDRVLTHGAVMLASEQVGGAQRTLDMSTEYAKTRKQFGRAIGSFQAIKHRLADTLKAVETARSTAYHAARALAEEDQQELAIAAPMAASFCGEVYEQAAGDNIQNHGGIGFTWEHDAHLYFKRAKSSKLLFGGPERWRRRLADTLDL